MNKIFVRDYDVRLSFALWMMEKVGDNANFIRYLMVTDECIFHTNGITSTQFTRIWSTSNPHWRLEKNNQYRNSVMVWCGIFNRKLIGPYFFDGCVNGQKYLQFLQTYLTENLENIELEDRRNMWFQHDGAPPHYMAAVKNWLNENFQNKWIGRGGPVPWPPRSPDCSPCDFFLWGYLKQIVYRTSVESVIELRQRISNACAKVTPEMLRKVEKQFQKRLQKCILKNGGHIEG